MQFRQRAWIVSVLAIAGLSACGGGDGGTTNPPPAGGFAVSLSSSTLSVAPGAVGTLTATIARTGTFAGTVALAVEGMPTGITGSFSPAAITAGTTSTTLTVTAVASTTPGTYTFTIRGSASGQSDQTASASLTVTAPPAIGLTLSLPTLAVAIGEIAQTTIGVTRTSLATPIVLTVAGVPTGVSTSITPSTIASETSTAMTVNAGANATPGTYSLTITATSGTVASSAVLQLTVQAARSLQLEATATTLTAAQGGSRSTTVTITRTNVPGNVTMVASGAPSGVTVVVDPNPTTGNTATVTFTIGAAVTPGTYPVTLTASATGTNNGTLPLSLIVTSSTPPSVALALSRPVLTTEQAKSDTTTLFITRTNYTQLVTVQMTGVPDGMSLASSENPTLGNSVRFTLTAGATAAPGTYPVTIQVFGSGLTPASIGMTLVITASPPGTGNVTWNFENCSAAQRPIWFGAADLPGAFQRISPNGNSFAFNIVNEGAVVYVVQNAADDYTVNFRYGLLADLLGAGTSFCASGTGRTVNGTIAGFSTSTQAAVSLGSSYQFLNAPQTAFVLANVKPGALDLVATRSAINPIFPAAGAQVNKLIIRRSVDAANGSTMPVLDFETGDAFDALLRAVTISGDVAGESLYTGVNYFSINSGFAILGQAIGPIGGTLPFSTVPSVRQAATDLHVLTAGANALNGSTSRTVTTVFKESANQAVTLGPVLATPTFTTVRTFPFWSVRVQLARQAEYDDVWTLGYSQLRRSVSVTMPSTVLGGGPFDFSFPDLSSVAGWQHTWAPSSGVTTSYSFTVSGWSGATGGFFLPYAEGTLIRSSTRTGTIPP